MEPTHPRFIEFNTPENVRAAKGVEAHADTPALTILDSLGREVISIAHNRVRDAAGGLKDEKYLTFTKLDAEGKPLWIRDARKNLVMQYIMPPVPNNLPADPVAGFAPCYDIAGNLLFQHSMDAGERWMLNDAAGKPMLAWDFNERQDDTGVTLAEQRLFFTGYDALHRPLEHRLTINGGTPQLIERFEYVDAKDNPNLADAKARNLCGQLHKHYDASGLKQVERIDFKGKPEELRRQLATEYRAPVIGWQSGAATAGLDAETFVQIIEYDTLSRITRLYQWHRLQPNSRVAVYEPHYNARGLLESEDIVVRATKTATGYMQGPGAQRTTAIAAVRYNAKGQKERIDYGNRTITRYHYDPETFRLVQLRTTRPSYDPPFPQHRSGLADDRVLQQLLYTYDPVGNITEIHDDAYEPAFFQNQQVEAVNRYTYDALYRLLEATGRESGAALGPPQPIETAPLQVQLPVPDPNALRNYTQHYRYDAVGNIEELRHGTGGNGGWTQHYAYAGDSNRLLRTWHGNNINGAIRYGYDPHGNLLNLANVAPEQSIRWDHRDMIHALDLQGGGRAYYAYDADKQRTRKRLERLQTFVEERIDLGGMEISRKYLADNLVEEIESIHLFEGERRVLLIDDVLETDNPRLNTGPLYRYQYSNHLGSAALELDDHAVVISYEEYYPYGSTSYQAVNKDIKAAAKRYRYTGKERDEESGLYYHGARYYAPWLGRWVSCDPITGRDEVNLYSFVKNRPLVLVDPDGKQPGRYGDLSRPFPFVRQSSPPPNITPTPVPPGQVIFEAPQGEVSYPRPPVGPQGAVVQPSRFFSKLPVYAPSSGPNTPLVFPPPRGATPQAAPSAPIQGGPVVDPKAYTSEYEAPPLESDTRYLELAKKGHFLSHAPKGAIIYLELGKYGFPKYLKEQIRNKYDVANYLIQQGVVDARAHANVEYRSRLSERYVAHELGEEFRRAMNPLTTAEGGFFKTQWASINEYFGGLQTDEFVSRFLGGPQTVENQGFIDRRVNAILGPTEYWAAKELSAGTKILQFKVSFRGSVAPSYKNAEW